MKPYTNLSHVRRYFIDEKLTIIQQDLQLGISWSYSVICFLPNVILKKLLELYKNFVNA